MYDLRILRNNAVVWEMFYATRCAAEHDMNQLLSGGIPDDQFRISGGDQIILLRES